MPDATPGSGSNGNFMRGVQYVVSKGAMTTLFILVLILAAGYLAGQIISAVSEIIRPDHLGILMQGLSSLVVSVIFLMLIIYTLQQFE